MLDTADLHTVLVGTAVVVLGAGSIALFRWLAGWMARRIAAEFRDAVAEIVYELKPNGGNSAVDKLNASINSVGTEVAWLSERFKAMDTKVDTHLHSSAEYGAQFVEEGRKVLARLDALEGKTTVNVNIPPQTGGQ